MSGSSPVLSRSCMCIVYAWIGYRIITSVAVYSRLVLVSVYRIRLSVVRAGDESK